MRFTVRSKLGLILSLTTILTVVSAFMVMAIANRGMGAHAAASQSLPTGGLTFASTPTSAAIVSSSVVTAAGKGTSGGGVPGHETPPLNKWAKGDGPPSGHGQQCGERGRFPSSPGHARPGASFGFIGQR